MGPRMEKHMSTPLQKTRVPIIDTPVFSLEGQKVGFVNEIHGGYFKIDTPMARDYWLSDAYISESTLDRVQLTLRKAEMDKHRLSAPGAEGQTGDGIISDEEALTQRERMERELAMQNERLRNGGV